MRAIPVRRNGFARVLTLRNVRSLGVFAVGGKRVGKGEGERRTRERSDEKRENAAARVSRKFHYFTLFPSWSTTLFTAFISFSPLHLKSSNIADLSSYNAYTRMIMRMMNAIVRQITMNINFCEQNTESCRHSSMFTHRSRVEERERQRERESWKENGLCMFFSNRAKKKEKKTTLIWP